MQEVNFKKFIILIYFTYISVLGPKFAQEIPASGFVGLCLGVLVSETSSYFTHIILSQPFTNIR